MTKQYYGIQTPGDISDTARESVQLITMAAISICDGSDSVLCVSVFVIDPQPIVCPVLYNE